MRLVAPAVPAVVSERGSPYDGRVEVFARLRRRPLAGIGLVVALAWIAVAALECFTTHPLDRGGAYAYLVQVASFAGPGVFGVAAFTWLLERAAS